MLYSFENHELTKLEETRLRLSEPTDAELLTRMAVGDEAALANLAKRHKGLLKTVIARVISDEHDVDEIFHETLLDVWNKASHYAAEKGQAIAWVVTVARRRAIDRVRRKLTYGRAKERFEEHEKTSREKIDTHTAERDAATTDLREVFSELLKGLPAPQREALSLNMYGGLSQRQIAAKTQTPLGTIKTRLELAIRKIRSAILAQAPKGVWMRELMA